MSCTLKYLYLFLTLGLGLWFTLPLFGQEKPSPPIQIQSDHSLVYQPTPLGDRVPDYSYCGYMAGEKSIPMAQVKVFVSPKEGDMTKIIQAALEYVGSLPKDQNGLRGAVLLDSGTFQVDGQLLMSHSGVVLRGSGFQNHPTIILGNTQKRATLIQVGGDDCIELGDTLDISATYTPVNAREIQVKSTSTIKKGDMVRITRYSSQAWIDTLKMNEFGGETGYLGWKPGERNLIWDRKVVEINDSIITLDAPITTSIDEHFGGGFIQKILEDRKIEQIGIENLQMVSIYDPANPKDESHRWMAITMDHVRDGWVRQVSFKHFAGSAVAIWQGGRRITIEDCLSLQPVSEIGGQRRYTFWTEGQQTLFQRLYAEHGYHDFSAGFRAGLNAFVQCESFLPYSFSGAIDSWASGILFDNVRIDGQALSFSNRGQDAQGAGWTAANSMFWQCSAARINCFQPPMAQNYAYGAWSQFAGNGYWYEANSHIQPRSLYYAQLQDRLSKDVSSRAQLLPMDSEASSSPTVAEAATLTAQAQKPPMQLREWIGLATQRNPVSIERPGSIAASELHHTSKTPINSTSHDYLTIQNGWITQQHQVLTGKQRNVPWWRGNVRYYDQVKSTPHVTRWVPGKSGVGLTDELSETIAWMEQNQIVALDHNYGLWYERRRDDHERVRRSDGEVWAPFYELPFARSGRGTAWDGMSQYDLTKYNPWYWSRLQEFGKLAAEHHRVLIHQNYFQHNILEAGAHWADFPWRSANNINEVGFPEPPPYAGDKRIFMDAQFYDISHPSRRKIHEAYIRKCLNSFADNPNVIQTTGAEFTGPLYFVRFWLTTVANWEKKTGNDATIALSVTKDVQDSILADPVLSSVVDVIDIRYWHYQKNGQLYAPKGGHHLAPRQQARLLKPKGSNFEETYHAVSSYKKQFPDKAVMYSAEGDRFPWAVFMAGGSLAPIPAIEPGFLASAATMQPSKPDENIKYLLTNNDHEQIVYAVEAKEVRLNLSATRFYTIQKIDPETGNFMGEPVEVKGKSAYKTSSPQSPIIYWVRLSNNQPIDDAARQK